ncbi:MAG: GAF domain-containing protein [Candidatus Eisenbacteria bacterium]|nr:GAF domain-containing protein [Candidatus Eisenbacteria bacterium]
MQNPDDPIERDPPLPEDDPVGDLEELAALEADLGPAIGPSSDTPVSASRPKNGAQDPELERAREWSAKVALDALKQEAPALLGEIHLQALVRRILDAALRKLGAERGVIFLGGGGDQGLVPVLARNLRGEELEEVEGISRTILAAARSGALRISDAQRDPRFRDVPSVRAKRVRSVATAPMLGDGERIGIIYVDAPSRSHAFPDQAHRFLEAFARLAGVAVRNAQIYGELRQQNERLRQHLDSLHALGRLDASGPRMKALLRRASVAALVDAPLMIVGEEGTERELLARSIHELGPRVAHPFVAVHGTVLDARLREALLEPSAPRTGAQETAPPGLLRQAERGILFVDDFHAVGPEAQERLVRLASAGHVRGAGRAATQPTDVRLICALPMSPVEAQTRGRLRRELLDELSPIELHLPPLRERPEEIPALVARFLARHAAAHGRRRSVSFTPEAIRFLQRRPWRGNLEELESLVQRVLVFSESERIDEPALADHIRTLERLAQIDRSSPARAAERASGRPKSLAEQERDAIAEALVHARGNRSAAARLLGVHRNSLLRRMKRLGITPEWAAAQRPRSSFERGRKTR